MPWLEMEEFIDNSGVMKIEEDDSYQNTFLKALNHKI
jgi:hypothetical protein